MGAAIRWVRFYLVFLVIIRREAYMPPLFFLLPLPPLYAGMRTLSCRDSKADQASSLPRPVFGFSQAGCFLLVSSKFSISLSSSPTHPHVCSTEPPFDRHDWIVRRRSTGEEVRYVIDYYEAPPEPDGSPCFSLDVRPALDSFGSIRDRIAVATEDAWAEWKSRQAGKAS